MSAECRHQYWDLGRCIDCLKTQNQIDNERRESATSTNAADRRCEHPLCPCAPEDSSSDPSSSAGAAARPALARPEVCICAAVKMGGLIIRGHRHDDCLRNIRARRLDAEPIEQGFITSHNRYVGREEAMRIQKAAGAKSCYSADGELHGDILFSEDLY